MPIKVREVWGNYEIYRQIKSMTKTRALPTEAHEASSFNNLRRRLG
jgi:hypothetical protein